MKIATALALALFACGSSATASAERTPQQVVPPRPDLAELDGYIRSLTDAGQFSGVVLVAEGDTVVFERGYGHVDPNSDDSPPPNADSLFNLASAGKMFTATAILQQVARGKLSLDARLAQIIPGYCNKDFAAKVTIRNLLTHTDGAGGIDLFEVENAANRSKAKTVKQMVALHECRKAAFEPGTKTDYDNFGFVILGRILEIASGESYEDYLRSHVFAPAGMRATAFLDCTEQTRRSGLARGYTEIGGRKVSNCAKMPARGFPAGGQWSTARDMFQFTKALRKGKLIPLGLFQQATSVYRKGFGLGFFATDYGPKTPSRDFRWGHGGQGYQITNDVRVYPRTGETVIVLCNCDGAGPFRIADFLHRLAAEEGRAPLPPPGTKFPD